MEERLYKAATEDVALADFSHHARWIVKGTDAIRFLHGQCTHDVNALQVGDGCYACFLTHKGKLRGDAVIYRLRECLGIELAAGHAATLCASLEKFIIADDVQIADVTAVIRQGCVVGPKADAFLKRYLPDAVLPTKLYQCAYQPGNWSGDFGICLTHRANAPSYELFAPAADFGKVWPTLMEHAPTLDPSTLDTLRIEAGIPAFGVDMDENTIPIEAGLEARAISYTKGCYVGQEVISRIHSLGHVNRHLCKLHVADEVAGRDRPPGRPNPQRCGAPGGRALPEQPETIAVSRCALPNHGDKIQFDGKDVGQVTSAVLSPKYGHPLALGYVRREVAKAGTKLIINNQPAEVIELCGSGY